MADRSERGDRKDRQDKNAAPAPSRPKIKVVRESKSGVIYVDYKDTETLKRMISGNGKILGRKRTGASAMEQRMISAAIKRSRFMSLLPYVGVLQ